MRHLYHVRGDDPLAAVLSLNLHRRHMNASQRAVLGLAVEEELAKLARERQREAGRTSGRGQKASATIGRSNQPQVPAEEERARTQAAKVVGVGRTYIQDAKAVKTAAPDLIPKVASGELTIPQAKKEVREREAQDLVADAVRGVGCLRPP